MNPQIAAWKIHNDGLNPSLPLFFQKCLESLGLWRSKVVPVSKSHAWVTESRVRSGEEDRAQVGSRVNRLAPHAALVQEQVIRHKFVFLIYIY
jgi:hypothetical protein